MTSNLFLCNKITAKNYKYKFFFFIPEIRQMMFLLRDKRAAQFVAAQAGSAFFASELPLDPDLSTRYYSLINIKPIPNCNQFEHTKLTIGLF